MRIAYFSPLPPAASGIADYSAELLPHLSRYVDLTLFVNHNAPIDDTLADAFPIRDVTSFGMQRDEFDAALYHMGNHMTYHEGIYRVMREIPGIVVAHETVFYHFFHELMVVWGDVEAYHQLRNPCAYPYLTPILANALGVIVHSQYACRQIQHHRPDLPVAVIPHHLSLPAAFDGAVDREAVRRDLGLGGRFVIGSFGLMTEAKRPAVLLRAFARFRSDHPTAVCCLVGQETSEVDLAGLVSEAGLPAEAVRITGRVPLDEFLRYMIGTDVAVNLRYPTGGETSGSVIRLLGLGVPTVVSDVGAFSELPDEVCVKVPVDAWEEDTLVAVLEALALDDELRRAMGANARRHIRTHHTLEGSARAYAMFIEQVVAGEAEPVGPPATTPTEALISDIGRTLAGWGVTEYQDSLLQPIAEALGQLGIIPSQR